MAETPTYAELAAQVTELIEQMKLFKDQQVTLYTTEGQTASVTDGEGNTTVIPSWTAVQSAGSESGANAELAAASIYKFAAVTIAAGATSYTLPTGNVESWYNLTLNNTAPVLLTIPAPAIDSAMVKQITLNLIQGAGANRITWPTNVTWSNGRAPVLSFTAGDKDLITLIYAGQTIGWIGFFSAGGIGQ